MKTWKLAVRNLLRNRRRSLATLLALMIGATSILVFGGYSANIRYTMLTAYVRSGGHLQIQHRDFFLYGNGNPAGYGVLGFERLLDAIRNDPMLKRMVIVATPTLQFGGIAGNYSAGVSRTVLGMGYRAADVKRMREWNEYAIPLGSRPYALHGAAADAAIVGTGVARVLLLCEPLGVADCPKPIIDHTPLGAALPTDIAALADSEFAVSKKEPQGKTTIELLAGHGRGSPNVAALTVVAAQGQGFKELDEVAVVLQLAQAQALVYGRGPPRATAIIVQLESTSQIKVAANRLEALVASATPNQHLTVLDFQTLNPFYVQTLQLFDMIFGFIYVLIGGIVLFTVSNTMNAAVVERTVEIGTLRAIGLRRGSVRSLFVTEGFLLGCAGALTGAMCAILIGEAVNQLDLTWLPPGSSEPLPLKLRVWGEWAMITGTVFGLMVIAMVSAWWPAWRASSLKTVDALRHT